VTVMARAYFVVSPAPQADDLWWCAECGAVVYGASGRGVHDEWHAQLGAR